MKRPTVPAASVLLAAVALAACASAPPPAGSSRIRSLVLVETSGGSLDAEAFVSRFLLVLSEAGLGNVADARLAGGKIEMLKNAAAPDAVRFRESFPADGYLGLRLDPCRYAGQGKGIACHVTVLLLASDGKEAVRFDTSGSNATLISSNEEKSAEAEASRAAAEKAAEKLLKALPR